MNIPQLNFLSFDYISGFLGLYDIVPILKVMVLRLLTFKQKRDVDILLGKPILVIMQVTTLNFVKKRNAILGHGIPRQNVQIC